MSNENKTFKLDKYWLEEKGEINFKCCDFEEQDSLRSERWKQCVFVLYICECVCAWKPWNSWCLALSFLSNSGFHPEQKEIWPTAAPSIKAHSIIFNGFFHLHKKSNGVFFHSTNCKYKIQLCAMLIPNDAHKKQATWGQFDILAKLRNSNVTSWTKDPTRWFWAWLLTFLIGYWEVMNHTAANL